MFADNGGHMIASLFDGTVELINYFAQDANTNRSGAWYVMEAEWAAVIKGTRYPVSMSLPVIIPAVAGGQTVTNVVITPTFPSTTGKRPDGFNVKYTIGNNQPKTKTIQN